MASSRLKRINITVPESTLRLLDKVAPKGDRSRFITEAVHAYVTSRSRARLKAELKAGAIARGSRDLALVAEWSSIDPDTWPGRKK
jgi:Predicted transcriptional regulators containing the CopG/Arc/MetJ DNA-binding domain and a metal-binding domain